MDVITSPENLQTTSGLSIILHGVISLRDAMSYDKIPFQIFSFQSYIGNKFRMEKLTEECKSSERTTGTIRDRKEGYIREIKEWIQIIWNPAK